MKEIFAQILELALNLRSQKKYFQESTFSCLFFIFKVLSFLVLVLNLEFFLEPTKKNLLNKILKFILAIFENYPDCKDDAEKNDFFKISG